MIDRVQSPSHRAGRRALLHALPALLLAGSLPKRARAALDTSAQRKTPLASRASVLASIASAKKLK